MPEVMEVDLEEKRRNQVKLWGDSLRKEFDDNALLRADKETDWIEELRQCKGIYDPEAEEKMGPKDSKVYPKYTRSKEVPCIAKLNSLLFSDNDKNWSIVQTPDPDIPKEVVRDITLRLVRKDEEGTIVIPTADEVNKAIKQFAKETCKRMEIVMDDQITEMKYIETCKQVLRSGIRFGTGILKGPLSEKHTRTILRDGESGVYSEDEVYFMPTAHAVLTWNWYPDMSTTDYDQAKFTWERHRMNRYELRNLSRKKGFKSDVIKVYIKEHPKGDYTYKDWETQLLTMGEGQTTQPIDKNYEVLERWGFIDGYDLQAFGVDIPDSELDEDYWGCVFLLGKEVIKAVKVEMNPYHVFYYEKDETSIFGSGLPRAIRDTQLTICAAARMMLNNGAKTTGPITEINEDLLAPGEEVDDLDPNRIISREGKGQEAQYPAIRVYNVESHINEYIMIIQEFKQFGDEESTFPAFIWGEPGKTTNETAKGISIRSSNTLVTLGDIVKFFDVCNESFLRALYQWNMKYNPRKDIKGDFKVKAVGSASLLSKEIRTQGLDFFATTLGPSDEPYIKRGEFLRIRAKLHDLDPDDFIRTDEEAQEIIKSQLDEEAIRIAKAEKIADIEYTKSKAAHMRSKAGATNQDSKVKTLQALTEPAKEGKGE